MPIAMTKDEWARITRWADANREDPETVRRREYVKYLSDTSQEMTKNWPNSLENVNKRNEELRRARIEAAEQANTKFYKRYVKRQREEQQRLMYSARDTVFKNKDAPKLMLSAVIETVIQKEREEQIKFKKELQRQAAEQKRRDDDEVIRKAKEWHALNTLRDQRRFDANKKHQNEILEQAQEISERNRSEYEEELTMQKIDNVKADEQMDAIRNFEEEYKAAEKARIWSDMKRAKEEAEKRRGEQRARDSLDDQLIQVLLRSRARVDAKRKLTEQQIKEEKLRMLEIISKRLVSGDADREAREQQILNKAISEKEAATEARRQAQLRKEEKIRAERLASREEFLKKEEQRLHELNTMRQWDMMNRFKNTELYEAYQEKLREEKERKIQQYREDIIQQWKERDDRETRERAETRYFYGELAERKLRDADNKLLTHAHSLVQEAKKHGRPDHALQQAIDRYCKLYRLHPMPELPKSMQEHFKGYAPTDLSYPDPHYRYPSPPRFEEDKDDDDARRDGLQDPKPGPSKAPEKETTKQETEDYRRAAPANGLQRKKSQQEVKPPRVSKRACADPQCACELKRADEMKQSCRK